MATSQRGQALPLTVLVIAFALVLALGVTRLARNLALRSAAQHAADAVALAGALDGEPAAAEVARDNDAALVNFEQEGDLVWVEVRRRGARAQARAELVVELADGSETTTLPITGG